MINKSDGKVYAIKRITFNIREFETFSLEFKIISRINSKFMVKFFDYWLEINDKKYSLNIQMEFCSKTLSKIMNEINPRKSLIDLYICGVIFIEIFESVNYLHK